MLNWFAGGLVAIGFVGIILLIIFSFAWLIAYILISVGLFGAARKRGIANYGLAWIPIVRYYLLGKLLNDELIVTPKIRIPYLQIVLPVVSFIAYFGNYLGWLFSMALVVLLVISYIALYRQYKEPNPVAKGFLTGIPLVEVIGSVFMYTLADKPVPDPEADTTAFP